MNTYATKKQPEKVIDLNLPKILVIMITIISFFVLPAQIITYSKMQSNQVTPTDIVVADSKKGNAENGRVAGASTSAISQAAEGITIDFSDRSTQFILMGGFFTITAVATLLYLVQSEKNYRVDERNKEFQEKVLGKSTSNNGLSF
ncbi:MAG: hypothetical protein Kow0081_0740 [Candidatus Dojkabacteria bacterium]